MFYFTPISRILFDMNFEKLLFSYEGRMGVKNWWIMTLGIMAVSFVLGMTADLIPGDLGATVSAPISLLLMFIQICVNSKRLHDTNKSGWWQLIGIVPIIGWVWAIIVMGVLKSDAGKNDYGEPDRANLI